MAPALMFKKIFIANRGEIAIRVIRACRDMGISPAVGYSEADRESLHVTLADEAFYLGPAPSSESYLVIEKVIQAALDAGAEAVHPGYGFLAENAPFAIACRDAGLTFIGPSALSIQTMGSKISSRQVAQQAGVFPVPGSSHPLKSVDEALSVSNEIGYPVVLKADAGGGGKGLRVVESDEQIPSAYRLAQREAEAAFGDSELYLEKFIAHPRHIEIQVLGDLYGNLIHLGERECSIQRRHQKVIEECPSPLVDEELRYRLGEAALRIARSVGYSNAGTVEFLVDTSAEEGGVRFFFLEMNTRLQVEHAVTELVTGVDLVCEQIRIAAGEPLRFRQADVCFKGWAIECRVYAEDVQNNFYPAPGTITTLFAPSGPGIRNDMGVFSGFTIPLYYDPLISKLVAYGENREQAIMRLRRALREYKIGGIPTTVEFFDRLLSHPAFHKGELSTDFIDQYFKTDSIAPPPLDIPLLAAAVEYALREHRTPTRTIERKRWKDLGRQW